MIGSGLYTTSGFAFHDLRRADLVLIVWLIAGGMAICGAISYGALAKRVSLSGGEYVYLSRLIDPSIGFLAGWISLVAGFTAPIAAAAETFAAYLVPHSDSSTWSAKWIAIASIALGAALHSCGLRGGTYAQNVTVVVKLIGLVAILVFAALMLPSYAWHSGVLNPSGFPASADLSPVLEQPTKPVPLWSCSLAPRRGGRC